MISYHFRKDSAKQPLISEIREEILQSRTYKSFMKLLDNYSAKIGEMEIQVSDLKYAYTQDSAIQISGGRPLTACRPGLEYF